MSPRLLIVALTALIAAHAAPTVFPLPTEGSLNSTVCPGGMCPLDNAVCCSDNLHCCPQGTTCGSDGCYRAVDAKLSSTAPLKFAALNSSTAEGFAMPRFPKKVTELSRAASSHSRVQVQESALATIVTIAVNTGCAKTNGVSTTSCSSVEECADWAMGACSSGAFMFSSGYYGSWGTNCCSSTAAAGDYNPNWTGVYHV